MKIAVSLWLVCVGLSPVVCGAVPAGDAGDLADMRAKIRQTGVDVRRLAEEKTGQIEELRRLETQFGEQANQLAAIKNEIRLQEQALQDVRAGIATTQKNLQAQRRSLEGLVKSAHAMRGKEGLGVLLNQRDPALSGRMLVYYDYVSKARVQKLQLIEEDIRNLNRLESQKNTETQLLQVSLEKKQQETDALQKLKEQREKLLAQLNKAYAAKQNELVSLIHDEKKLESLLASLPKTDDNVLPSPPPAPVVEKKPVISESRSLPVQPKKGEERPKVISPGKPFAELQGQLPWPVQGAILERFGSRRFETTWDGTVIGAREGADIHAVAAGRVVYADWLRGYGLMIIVDHGKGYMSLYAFNQSLHKNVGDYVREGESLASVGRSGGRAQAALYFGIRSKGRAIDPEKWCRKLGKS